MNKMTDFSRTITALATALGTGSIAIIRVSGILSWDIVSRIFRGSDLLNSVPNSIHFGRIFDEKREIDQVIVLLFKAPHSYTGEDSVEISCHSNPLIVDEIVSLLIRNGADHAKPGEFTLRAYLNGKIDLSQAEAVSGIINAKSRPGVINSLHHLEGALTVKIHKSREKIVELIANLEIDLDFSEEHIKIASPDEMIIEIKEIYSDLLKLSQSFNFGHIFNSGINLAIIGEPNVGKSTLMNSLLGHNRVITSAIPGTTRDTVKENLVIDNIYITLTDTAGLRQIDDEIENEGIKRAEQTTERADIILYIVDMSQPMNDDSIRRMKLFLHRFGEKIIIIGNKNDCTIQTDPKMIKKYAGREPIQISALKSNGIDVLRHEIRSFVQRRYESLGDEIIVTSARQRDSLVHAAESLNRAKESIERGEGYEFVVVDMREALNSLGEITGETVSDDILNYIFSNFCIGK
jgi:tRNA modification GTPase